MIRRSVSVLCFVAVALILPVLLVVHSEAVVLEAHVEHGDRFNSSLVRATQGFIADGGSVPGVYEGRAKTHLGDVRSLVAFGEIACVVLLLVAVVAGASRSVLYESSVATVSVVLALGVFGGVWFSSFFSLFHQVFFEQGSYVFPSDSLLIELFPASFFADLAFLSSLGSLGIGVSYALAGFLARA